MARRPVATHEGEGDIPVPREHVDWAAKLDRALDASGMFDPPDADQGGHANSYPMARLQEIQRALSLCWPHSRVIAVYCERWGVQRGVIKNYIERVYEELREDDARHITNRRNRMRAAIEQHFHECMAGAREKDKENRPTAQRAALMNAAGADLDRLAKIDGCYIERVELTGAHGGALQLETSTRIDLSALSDEELDHLERITGKIEQVPLAVLPGRRPAGTTEH